MKLRLTLIFLLVYIGTLIGQKHYTPYDELPGINKTYKPAYDKTYPEWAKLLYQYPVNYYDVVKGHDTYIRTSDDVQEAFIKYFQHWQDAVSEYVGEDGVIHLPNTSELIKEENKKSALIFSDATKSIKSKGEDIWTFWGPKITHDALHKRDIGGPTPWQANVYSIDVSASDNNILYCGTETGFVNKSTDKGQTWNLVSKYYPMRGVKSITIHPTNPDIVIAAGANIHKTTNGAVTWETVYTSTLTNKIYFDYTNPLKVFAASTDRILVSENGGDTWSSKYSTENVYDIAIKPDDNNIIYAITGTSGDKFSIVRSEDGGNNFSVDTTFPADIENQSGGVLSVTPDNPNLLFVLLLGINDTPFLYKGELSDNSWSWTKIATGNTTALPLDNGQGYYDLTLDVSPIDEDIIFAGTTTLFKSINGGDSFTKVGGYGGDFAIHPDIQDIKMMPNGDTWVATDGGVNFSSDYFISQSNWKSLNYGLIGSGFWGFDQGWNEDLVCGGRYHNGNTVIADFYGEVALRMGGAEAPTGWVLNGKSRHVAFSDLGQGWIIPKTYDGAKEEYGRFEFTKHPNMRGHIRRGNVVTHPNYADIIYVGEGTGFWKSTDGGSIFELIHSFGINDPNTANENGVVRYFQISHKNPDVIYADIDGMGLYKSEDGGYTWMAKTSLTTSLYAGSSAKGELTFDISPYDENVIYAGLSIGSYTMTTDSKIFKSTNGGNTWTNITTGLDIFPKVILALPSTDNKDRLYFAGTANKSNSEIIEVYTKKDGDASWQEYEIGLPSGMRTLAVLPFYRDSKLRLCGSGGVWEAPIKDSFNPIVNPMSNKREYDCLNDTVYLDDYSMLDHKGATWKWEFSSTPEFVSDVNKRQVKAVFSMNQSIDVTLTVTKDGVEYSKTVDNMLVINKCPSIDDCDNPIEIDKQEWSIIYYDSYQNGRDAKFAIDNDPDTYWHTQWYPTKILYPHEVQVDLGDKYFVHSFTYLPRQDSEKGNVDNFELYFSHDKDDWGSADVERSVVNDGRYVKFDEPISASYFRFNALSAVIDGQHLGGAAELTLVGCYDKTNSVEKKDAPEIKAYPIPTKGILNLSNFSSSGYKDIDYSIVTSTGKLVKRDNISGYSDELSVDFSQYSSGIYILIMTVDGGTKYRVKVMKE